MSVMVIAVIFSELFCFPCKSNQSLMAINHTGLKILRNCIEYMLNLKVFSCAEMLMSSCKYVPGVVILSHINTEKYHKVIEA